MGTRSTIAMLTKKGIVRTVYCHWDGYLSNNGKILVEHYADYTKVEKLISLGSLSSLDESVECPEGHSFDNPADNCTIAYHRDRGNDLHISEYNSLQDYIDNAYTEEYDYIYISGIWFLKGDSGLIPVKTIMKEEE